MLFDFGLPTLELLGVGFVLDGSRVGLVVLEFELSSFESAEGVVRVLSAVRQLSDEDEPLSVAGEDDMLVSSVASAVADVLLSRIVDERESLDCAGCGLDTLDFGLPT